MQRRAWLLGLLPGVLLLALLVACDDNQSGANGGDGAPLGDAASDSASDSASPSASSESPESTTGTDNTGPKPPALKPEALPQVGDCRNYGYQSAVTGQGRAPVVSCSKPHTAYTFYTAKLTSEAAFDAEFARCLNSREKPLGVSPADVSGLIITVAAYMPGDEAWAAGARWFRCDLVVSGQRLVPLPTDIADAGNGDPPKRYAGCLLEENPSPISCLEPHDHVFAGAFKLARTQEPAERDLAAVARSQCNRIVGSSSWRVISPGDQFWKAGYRYVACWRATP